MKKTFADYLAALPGLKKQLCASKPLTADQIANLRSAGVYCFSEGDIYLYVGHPSVLSLKFAYKSERPSRGSGWRICARPEVSGYGYVV
jgi:hypothetical protein